MFYILLAAFSALFALHGFKRRFLPSDACQVNPINLPQTTRKAPEHKHPHVPALLMQPVVQQICSSICTGDGTATPQQRVQTWAEQHHARHRAHCHTVKCTRLLQGSTAAATCTMPRHPWPCYRVESSPNLSLRHLAHSEDQGGEFLPFRKDPSTSPPCHSNCWQQGEVPHCCSPLYSPWSHPDLPSH